MYEALKDDMWKLRSIVTDHHILCCVSIIDIVPYVRCKFLNAISIQEQVEVLFFSVLIQAVQIPKISWSR